jgi:APA family basic amino acid/polyamine antiporter
VVDPRIAQPPSRLERRLGLGHAVVLGLGSMIGAGIFAALAPAARYAGAGLLIGLAVAGAVAWCNATSSARLAALYPESGGTYVYGRRRLGEAWGYLAGFAFVAGKLASCAAMALTFGHYVAPSLARPLAVGACVALTAVNLRGIGKTAAATTVIVAVVLAALATFAAAALAGGDADTGRLSLEGTGVLDVLRSAGILFFAFAGYARIATLGEEVADPARTIPRAVNVSLGVTLLVYGGVALVALLVAGPETLAASSQPLRAVVEGSASWAEPVVAIGAAVACLGVLLSLLVGVSRTVFALAADGYLPRRLAAVDPVRRVPRGAELAVAAVVVAVVLAADVRSAIGFSSFCVLWYYAIANASAWTLGGSAHRRAVAAAGFVGCTTLAVTLPLEAIAAGSAVLAAGGVAYWQTRAPGSVNAKP